MPVLDIIDSEGKLSTLELAPGCHLTIGRADRCDIVFADRALSRLHAEISGDERGWIIRDCGSRNGTFLNGRRLTKVARLRPGDRVSMARCKLQFDLNSDSEDRVFFSDDPVSSGGTFVLSRNQISDPEIAPESSGRDISEENRRARVRFRVIENANLELLAHEPLDVLLPKVLEQVFRATKPERAALFLKQGDKLVCRAFRGDSSQGEMPVSRTISERVMNEQVSVLTSDSVDEPDDPTPDRVRSVLAVPLWDEKQVIGFIYADSRLVTGRFNSEDLRVLTMLANIAAIQIENASLFEERLKQQRIGQEVQAAAKLQRQLLPLEPPAIPGYLFEGLNIPCYEVGGDYYDCVHFGKTHHGIVLADVAGKGIPAAMLMAVLQASFHSRAEAHPEPEKLVRQLNRSIHRCAPSNRFVSLFYVDLDTESHQLRYINAGHAPAPIIVRADGSAETLGAKALPLGIVAEASYEIGHTRLAPGEFLFICTDGVTDTVDAADTEFGEERLEGLLRSMTGRSPADVRVAVEERLATHAAGTPQPDDLTLAVLLRSP